ncbi:hypothetical protein ACFVR6_03865 [Microbacterium sp. NPDC058021]|uniref:hypothetical protein n=1 Tax=Microbacterium sp. NPDC058021 TaxID=3346306 RepID=UPI0036DA137F
MTERSIRVTTESVEVILPEPVPASRAVGLEGLVEIPARSPWPMVRAVLAGLVCAGAVAAAVLAVTL